MKLVNTCVGGDFEAEVEVYWEAAPWDPDEALVSRDACAARREEIHQRQQRAMIHGPVRCRDQRIQWWSQLLSNGSSGGARSLLWVQPHPQNNEVTVLIMLLEAQNDFCIELSKCRGLNPDEEQITVFPPNLPDSGSDSEMFAWTSESAPGSRVTSQENPHSCSEREVLC